MTLTPSRAEDVDFAVPYGQAYLGIILPVNQRQQLDFWAYVNMFKPFVWLAILLAIIVVSMSFIIINWSGLEQLHNEEFHEDFDITNAFAVVYVHILQKQYELVISKLSSRCSVRQTVAGRD